jgi:hypothetical protein
VELPAHIADRIRALVASTSTVGHHIDQEAARHGAVALMGTIGSLWLMRPDGTLWDVDDDSGKHLQPLPPELHLTALVAGAERYPWLAELLPSRPLDALDCTTCRGRGRLHGNPPHQDHYVYCTHCSALGWIPVSLP